MSARLDTFRQQKPGGPRDSRPSAKQRQPVSAKHQEHGEETAGGSVAELCTRCITATSMLLPSEIVFCVGNSYFLALVHHAWPGPPAEDARAEAQLRAFDLDSKFGGCIGLTRLERCASTREQRFRTWRCAAVTAILPDERTKSRRGIADPSRDRW